MARRSRRRNQRSSNTMKYAAAAAVIVVIAVVGGYLYSSGYIFASPTHSTITTTTATTSSTSSNASGSSGSVYAVLNTTYGPVEVQLFPASAPKTVANFVSLANAGFYSNLVWHRIVPGFVIQTGDPNTKNGGGNRSTWGTGGSSQTVPLEIDPSLHNDIGYLGMARSSDPNSGSSQFYINLANNTSLDGQYTVFGKVISGMNVVDEIAAVPTNSASQPINPVYLVSVSIQSSP